MHAVQAQLGDFGNDVRNLAAIPPDIFARSAATCVLPDGSNLSIVQVGLVWRLARRTMWIAGGGNVTEWVGNRQWRAHQL